MLVRLLDRRSASDAYAYSQLTSKELNWLSSLAQNARLTPEIYLCHGTPSSDVEYFLETVENVVIRAAKPSEIQARLGAESSPLIAYTHIPRSVRTHQSQMIVNPGSVGLPAYDNIHPSAHVVETGSPDARYAIVDEGRDGWIVSLLSVPYNHRAMAHLVKLRSRREWEHALLTGYLP